MGALWLAVLIPFALVLVWAACRVVDHYRSLTPAAPLRVIPGGLGRIWPAWWDQLDQWRDEA